MNERERAAVNERICDKLSVTECRGETAKGYTTSTDTHMHKGEKMLEV